VISEAEDDDRVLECAVTGEREYVVTGHGDLLRMGSYEGYPHPQGSEVPGASEGVD
jgi:hypothetical protein